MRPKAIIVEDEENIKTGLKKMLQRLWPELDIRAEAETGKEALILIEREKPDVVFLDIHLPEINGLEIAKIACKHANVVFVTAYAKYAVDAFESEAIDYILKPASEVRLSKTISRVKKRLETDNRAANLDVKIDRVIQTLEKKPSQAKLRLIKVKSGQELRLLPVSQIYFFKAEHKYTTVQTAQNEFLIKTPIKELEHQLNPDQFWRIHRSTIVNIDRISKIKRSFTNMLMITFDNMDKTVVVSKSYEKLFQHM